MSKLTWDETGKRLYETGVQKGVLYPIQDNGQYSVGVAWNGLTTVTESPSGAEATPIYADDIKYLNLLSTEEFGATIEAYTYPDEFALCDGSSEISEGVTIGQQKRKTFGLSYRTAIGNDIDGSDYGYKLHLIYGALAAPSEKAYATINDSPEAITFSWEVSTTPVNVTGFKPTASLVIDSTKVDKAKMTIIENILYGTDGTTARLPLPDEIKSILDTGTPTPISVESNPTEGASDVAVSANIVLTFNNKIVSENVVLISAAGSVIPVTKSFNADGKVLTINPNANLAASTTYLINIIGVSDIFNQTLATTVKKFTTAS